MKLLAAICLVLSLAFLPTASLGLSEHVNAASAGLEPVLGDADCSSSVDAIDAAVILQLNAGLLSDLPCSSIADVNADEALDSLDALLILQQVAGLIGSFHAVLWLDVAPQSVSVGQEIAVNIRVEEVRHLAGFDLDIQFDPELLEFKRFEALGSFISDSERSDLSCRDMDREGALHASCVSLGAPVCLGGVPGASGSGLLGRAILSARAEGEASIQLLRSILVGDDIEPCDVELGNAQSIPHTRQDATVDIRGN